MRATARTFPPQQLPGEQLLKPDDSIQAHFLPAEGSGMERDVLLRGAGEVALVSVCFVLVLCPRVGV